MEERLQKLIAAAGLCSRRAAEQLIEAGKVTVNGQTASLGCRADPEKDKITVDGKPLVSRPQMVYLMLNKPRGYTCSLSDPHAAHLVTELVKDCGVRVYPVGRLDVESQGLLLLTNDGDFTHRMIHPSHQMPKRYHVTVTGFQKDSVERLSAIRSLDGEPIQGAKVWLLSESRGRATLAIIIHEGKKRQIRRMCAAVGLSVRTLCRIAEGAVELADLKEGAWRYLTAEEVEILKGNAGK